MKFLIDENLSKKLASFLNQFDYPTLRVRKINPGIDDYQVLELALLKDSILITSDKDFGELVFKEKLAHCGVILLRLEDEAPNNTIRAIRKFMPIFNKFDNKFAVITEKKGEFYIRFGSI